MKTTAAQIVLALAVLVLVAVCVPDAIQASLAMPQPVEMVLPREAGLTAAEIEASVLALVNVQRERAGLRPLAPLSTLTQVARTRSQDMAERAYLSHHDPETNELAAFAMLARRGLQGGGENLFLLQGQSAQAPESAVSWWMDSRTHRANILRPDYAYTGVGVAISSVKVYVTQIFLERP